VFINHRPAFGLDPGKLLTAFETLGMPTPQGNAIERGDLLDMLQTKGKSNNENNSRYMYIRSTFIISVS
jgi:hypothetical protein